MTLPGYQVDSRVWMNRAQLEYELMKIKESPLYQQTIYFTPDSCLSSLGDTRAITMVNQVPNFRTGVALFYGCESGLAILPPFPIRSNQELDFVYIDPLLSIVRDTMTVGVILLRLGMYAVGVIKGAELLVSKTGTRYVKNRHRKGGSSQRRFERNRERWIKDLFEKVCSVTEDVFRPHNSEIDYFVMGGEKHTLSGFLEQCNYINQTGIQILGRRVDVKKPDRNSLNEVHKEILKTLVIKFVKTGT